MTSYQTELIIGGDSSQASSEITKVKLLLDGLGRTYKNVSLDGTKGADNTAAAYERLRRQMDPLYATSKRYENAVRTLQASLKAKIITQAQYDAALERTALSMNMVEHSVEGMNRQIRSSRFHTANIAAQFNDIGVMFAAGQNPFMTAIQQGTQLNQVFAQIGGHRTALAALGPALMSMINPMSLLTIGGIAAAGMLVQWGISMASAKEETKAFDEMIKGLTEATADYTGELAKLRTGLDNVFEANAVERAAFLRAEIERLTTLIQTRYGHLAEGTRNFVTNLDDILKKYQTELNLLDEKLAKLEQERAAVEWRKRNEEAFIALMERGVKAAEDRVKTDLVGFVARMADAIDRAEKNQQRLNTAIAATYREYAETRAEADKLEAAIMEAYRAGNLLSKLDIAGGIISAADAASILAANLGVSVGFAARLAQIQAQTPEQNREQLLRESGPAGRGLPGAPTMVPALNPGLFTMPDNPKVGGGGRRRGGGGGGAKENKYAEELEQLREFLMTEAELELNAHMKRQETLKAALDQRLLTQQEYLALEAQLQQQHADKMAEIDAYRYGDSLLKAETFFGEMADAFAGGNEEMQRIGKVFGAAEALVNAWRAYSQTLADPTLPWFAKIPKAVAVLAAGMQAVSAIKGGRKSGPSGGGNSAAAPVAAPAGTFVNVTLQGGNQFGRQQVIGLIAEINKALEDGAVIKGIRVNT